jgi:hypothetical protein
MADETGELSGGLKPGDKMWYCGVQVTIVYIIPAHQWPRDHDEKIDKGVVAHMTQPKWNTPQQSREHIDYWKKWREDAYVVCYPPDKHWVCKTRRAKLSELSHTPPEGVAEIVVKTKTIRRKRK